jgi:hypothetical protein
MKEAAWADGIITRTSALLYWGPTSASVDINVVIREMAVLLRRRPRVLGRHSHRAWRRIPTSSPTASAAAGVDEPDAERDRGDEGHRRGKRSPRT